MWNRSCPHREGAQICLQAQSLEPKPQLLRGLSSDFSPFLSALTKDLLQDWDFFGQAIAVVTQPSQGLSANESETCGLNFPQKLNSCGLRYKRENNVFQRMVWVLKNFKCWGNSLGTHLTFNYSQQSVIQKTLNLHSFQWCVICSGKTTYIVIICIWRSTHLHNFVKSSHRIGENGTE